MNHDGIKLPEGSFYLIQKFVSSGKICLEDKCMRQIIIDTMAPILWILTIFDAISIFRMFRAYKRHKVSEISLLTGILCLGLFYDSLMLSLGAVLPFGSLLKFLSQFRYRAVVM